MPAMLGVSGSEGEDDNVDAPQEDHPFEAIAGLCHNSQWVVSHVTPVTVG